MLFLPPTTKLGQGYIFRSVCPHSVHGGGRAWLLPVGACVVAPGGTWLLPGGCAWLLWGACVVAPGGHAWLLGGHAWDTTRYGDTVNEGAVRILLECILVICQISLSQKMSSLLLSSIIVEELFEYHATYMRMYI